MVYTKSNHSAKSRNTIYGHITTDKNGDCTYNVTGDIADGLEVFNVGFQTFKRERFEAELSYYRENYPCRVIIWRH